MLLLYYLCCICEALNDRETGISFVLRSSCSIVGLIYEDEKMAAIENANQIEMYSDINGTSTSSDFRYHLLIYVLNLMLIPCSFSFREKKQKIEDIKKNIRDAILVSTHLCNID